MAKSKDKGRPLVKAKDRMFVRDCQVGDVMEVICWECELYEHCECNGGVRTFVFCSWLNNGPFAREIVGGEEGEIGPLSGSLRMELIQ